MRTVEECIVLAGGLGTRLREAVPDKPKPLAPVAGRPFLAWLLDRLAEQGMRHVVLATGYRGELIEAEVGDTWRGLSISYSREETQLGTGGAIRQACKLLSSECTHVMNGDTYVDYDMQALVRAADRLEAPIGMVLTRVEDASRYGTVHVEDGRASAFREKLAGSAGHINAGAYYLSARAIAALPRIEKFSFEEDVLRPAVARGDVAVLEGGGRFIDIGVPEDYVIAQHWFGAV